MLYDNDNNYLYAFADGDFKYFRVDRMEAVEKGTKERQGLEEFEKIDIPTISKSTFGMFKGREEKVTMVLHKRMIDTVVDKFGKDVWLSKVDDDHFEVTVTVVVSPQFYAWVFGLEDNVTITAPDCVVKQMKDMLAKVSKRYDNEKA